MLLFTVGVLLALSSVQARPTVRELAAQYAALHPNVDGSTDECQVLVEEGTELYTGGVNPLNAVINPARKWPANTVYYSIVTTGYNDVQLAQIQAGIDDLQELTKVNGVQCIYIQPRTTQTDYVSVENYSGCSSYVGRIGGRQRLSLVASCVTRHGTIMHEFIHALGFHHEQCRTDRDDNVIINWENIQAGYENNFVKYGPDVITLLGTPYDYGSVMHYGAYGFAIDPSIPTIITINPEGSEIGQRVTLSEIDIERIQIHYGCKSARDSVHFKHLAQ